MKKRRILVIERGKIKEIVVSDLSSFNPISLINGKILYEKKEKKKKKRKEKKEKIVITEKEKEGIRELKGQKSFKEYLREKELIEKVRENEKKIIKEIKNLKRKDIYLIKSNLNQNKLIFYENKIFNDFNELNNNSVQIYRGLIEKLIKTKNEKFINRLYELRNLILKEGILMEVDLFGRINKLRGKIHYLMSVGISGLLIEEAGFLENMKGWTGEARNVVPYLDNQTKINNGKKAFLIKSNIALDTAVIYIDAIKIKLSYA